MHSYCKTHFFCLASFIAFTFITSKQSFSQEVTSKANKLASPEVLPGNGMKQHDFFYAGEAKARNMYIIKKGKITWSYIDTTGKGEISDAVLMSNGNVLFAHQFGVTLINSDK